jgi:hypothetical protein
LVFLALFGKERREEQRTVQMCDKDKLVKFQLGNKDFNGLSQPLVGYYRTKLHKNVVRGTDGCFGNEVMMMIMMMMFTDESIQSVSLHQRKHSWNSM